MHSFSLGKESGRAGRLRDSRLGGVTFPPRQSHDIFLGTVLIASGQVALPKGKDICEGRAGQTEDSTSTNALRHTCSNSKERGWEERGGKTEAMSQNGSQ